MNRLIAIMTGLLLAGGVAGCAPGEDPAPETAEPAQNVRALVLSEAGSVTRRFEISGPVAAVRGTDLAAEEPGAVVAMPVAKGARVRAGDAIVVQDRVALAAEADAAVAAEAVAEFNRDKLGKLFDAGKISRFDLLQADESLAQARSRLAIARHRHARAAVSAPFDGVVVDRYVELGQYVLPGQAVARIIDPDTLKLTGFLTDAEVAQVHVGDPCLVHLGDAALDARGFVSFISLEADGATGKFRTEVRIPAGGRKLRSGVIGRAVLTGGSEEGMVIPRDATLPGLAGEAVFVLRGNRVRQVAVELGAQQGRMVAVRHGLSLGDTLVVRGQRTLRDGGLVRVVEWATGADGSRDGDPRPEQPAGERSGS